MSALPPKADITKNRHHVGEVPMFDLATAASVLLLAAIAPARAPQSIELGSDQQLIGRE
jgi:hypothetical protein